MKQLLRLACASLFSVAATGAVSAQTSPYPLVEISDIQSVPAARLLACDDAPGRVGDTVTVRGIVITPGGLAQSASGRQVWIRAISGQGDFQTIGIRSTIATAPNDVLNFAAGDTVEVAGLVQEFNGTNSANPTNDGETQILPLANFTTNIGDATGPAPQSNLIANLGVLNDVNRLNNLSTGEALEGSFIEVRNVTVTALSNFSGGTRYSFTIQDAFGNKTEVSDRFLAQRTLGGFIPPRVGDQFVSLKGIVIHSKNRCASTGQANRGYEINPFDASHYVRGASAPSIGQIRRSSMTGCQAQVNTVSAKILDDGTIQNATLYYSVGIANTTYTSLPLIFSATDTTYRAQIPGQADGSFVKYYIQATDNSGNISTQPTVATTPGGLGQNPLFYTARCGGNSIRDLQYTIYPDGNSGYRGMAVDSIVGVVSASASDLGFVYVQQPGQPEWGGIWVTGGSQIATLQVGDNIRMSGIIEENFNVTRLSLNQLTVLPRTNTVAVTSLFPNQLSTYDFAVNERYEGMLVNMIRSGGGNLLVVDTNYLAPNTNPTFNNGEYRVGTSLADPADGFLVQVGRQTSSAYSSYNVSYINSSRFATNLTVPPVIVRLGDQFSSVTGIVYFSFATLKVLPRTNSDMPGFVTQLREQARRRMITVGPNPATNHFTIRPATFQITEGMSEELITANDPACGCPRWKGTAGFTLTDAVGQPTGITGTITEEPVTVDTQNLSSGLYNLIITTEDQVITERIVVE
jgi:hypothetical protein